MALKPKKSYMPDIVVQGVRAGSPGSVFRPTGVDDNNNIQLNHPFWSLPNTLPQIQFQANRGLFEPIKPYASNAIDYALNNNGSGCAEGVLGYIGWIQYWMNLYHPNKRFRYCLWPQNYGKNYNDYNPTGNAGISRQIEYNASDHPSDVVIFTSGGSFYSSGRAIVDGNDSVTLDNPVRPAPRYNNIFCENAITMYKVWTEDFFRTLSSGCQREGLPGPDYLDPDAEYDFAGLMPGYAGIPLALRNEWFLNIWNDPRSTGIFDGRRSFRQFVSEIVRLDTGAPVPTSSLWPGMFINEAASSPSETTYEYVHFAARSIVKDYFLGKTLYESCKKYFPNCKTSNWSEFLGSYNNQTFFERPKYSRILYTDMYADLQSYAAYTLDYLDTTDNFYGNNTIHNLAVRLNVTGANPDELVRNIALARIDYNLRNAKAVNPNKQLIHFLTFAGPQVIATGSNGQPFIGPNQTGTIPWDDAMYMEIFRICAKYNVQCIGVFYDITTFPLTSGTMTRMYNLLTSSTGIPSIKIDDTSATERRRANRRFWR